MAPLAIAVLLLLAPAAQAVSEAQKAICRSRGLPDNCLELPDPRRQQRPPQPLTGIVSLRACENEQQRDCWTQVPQFESGGPTNAWAHPAGWLVDERCFQDPRFDARRLKAALDEATNKLGPACLGRYNPDWSKDLLRKLAGFRPQLRCPQDYDIRGGTCADFETRRSSGKAYPVISLRNMRNCLGPKSSDFAGTLFHEFLHAAGADNFPTEKHNKSFTLPQIEFVKDKVYGAEAFCFLAPKPDMRQYVHFYQCHGVVSPGGVANPAETCRDFNRNFTDVPAFGLFQH